MKEGDIWIRRCDGMPVQIIEVTEDRIRCEHRYWGNFSRRYRWWISKRGLAERYDRWRLTRTRRRD
jgi:hypothetical protein